MLPPSIMEKMAEYNSIPAVTTAEEPLLRHLEKDFATSDHIVQREKGLLVVRSRTLPPNPLILTAHVDRNGLIVNEDGAFEYSMYYAQKKHGHEISMRRSMFANPGKRFMGEPLVAYDPRTGTTLGEGTCTGFTADAEHGTLLFTVSGMPALSPGTPAAFQPALRRHEGIIEGQLDNVVSLAVARQLIRDGFTGMLLLSAEEECGRSAGHIANYLEKEGITSTRLLTLDTSPYDVLEALTQGWLLIRKRDKHSFFDKEMAEALMQSCRALLVTYESKDDAIAETNAQLQTGEEPRSFGVTELGRIIHLTKGKLNGATLQIPTAGYHTNHEKTSELALENYYDVLSHITKKLENE